MRLKSRGVLSRAQIVEKATAADLKPGLSSKNVKTMSSWLISKLFGNEKRLDACQGVNKAKPL
jgi:hypothetical protein